MKVFFYVISLNWLKSNFRQTALRQSQCADNHFQNQLHLPNHIQKLRTFISGNRQLMIVVQNNIAFV
jgi:hypothetical protein